MSDHSITMPPAFQALMRWEELCLVDPRTLDDNPLNWREHPPSQQEAVLASIRQAGWVMPLLYNLTTSKLVDGHGRKEKAIKAMLQAVPVAKGRWTKEEEIFLLQNYDAIGSMFRANTEKLANLNALASRGKEFLNKASQETKSILKKLQGRMEALPDAIESGKVSSVPLPISSLTGRKPEEEEEETLDEEELEELEEEDGEIDHSQVSVVVQSLEDKIIFPSTNPWKIPDYDPDMLATPDMIPEMTFSRTRESVSEKSYYCFSARPFDQREELEIKGGCLGFFTEDWRFEKAFNQPSQFYFEWIAHDWSCVLQPDYSTYEEWPFAQTLWNLYRSRWVARYWQSLGIRIVPILQSVYQPSQKQIYQFLDPEMPKKQMEELDDSVFDIGLITLPTPCPVIAVQCRTIKHHGGDFKAFAKWLSHRIEFLQPEVVMIYGGGDHQSKFLGYLPAENSNLRYALLQSYSAERRGWMKRQEKLRKKAK